jgi:hypothetical protein
MNINDARIRLAAAAMKADDIAERLVDALGGIEVKNLDLAYIQRQAAFLAKAAAELLDRVQVLISWDEEKPLFVVERGGQGGGEVDCPE